MNVCVCWQSQGILDGSVEGVDVWVGVFSSLENNVNNDNVFFCVLFLPSPPPQKKKWST